MVHPLYAVCALTCAVINFIIPVRNMKDLAEGGRVESAFLKLISWTAAFCVADGFWGLVASTIIMNDTLLFIMSTVFHVMAAITPLLWLYFLFVYLGNPKYSKLWSIISGVFVLSELIMLVANGFTQFMFYVDGAGEYCSTGYRRILFYLQYITYVLIAILAAINYIKERNRGNSGNSEEEHNHIAVLLFVAAPVVCGVFQMIYPDAPAYSIGYTIGCCVIYSFVLVDMFQKRMVNQAIDQENQRQRNVVKAFSREYASVYLVNIKTGATETIKRNSSFKERFGDFSNFQVNMKQYIAEMVVNDDKVLMYDECDLRTLKRRSESDDSYSVEFRELSGTSECWLRMSVAKLSGIEVIIGFSDADDEIIKRIISENLIAEYASIFLVDIDNDSYRFIYRNDESGFADVLGGCYSDTIREYTSRVDEEYRGEWEQYIEPESIRQVLSNDNRKEYVYRLSGIEKQWRRCVMYVTERRGSAATKFIMTYITLDTAAAEALQLQAQVAKQKEQLEEQTKQLELQQRELEYALDEAENANQSKSTFLFNMSHDIRTPMNAINGYADMAIRHIDDKDRVQNCLEKIGIAGNNLLDLINQVLDMSRIESGKVALVEEPADIIEKAYEIVELVSHSAESKDIELNCNISNVRDRKVFADTGRMNQLMLNILGNAIKYTMPGGKVTLTAKQLESFRQGYGTYRFSVEDTGIGMSHEFIETIFEPFTRENSTTVSKIEGTGLGMSIVKRLTDLMGGRIDIDSELGKGTRISITVDLKLDNGSTSTVGNHYTEVDNLKGKRVLLVEDNEMNLEIATEILEEHGLIVETANDGDVAVKKIMNIANDGNYNYYDFILMDIQMPRMNGYEATKAIRDILDPAGKHIPIIAMTANAFDEDRRNAYEAGMDAHLAKPIEVEKLWKTISVLLKEIR